MHGKGERHSRMAGHRGHHEVSLLQHAQPGPTWHARFAAMQVFPQGMPFVQCLQHVRLDAEGDTFVVGRSAEDRDARRRSWRSASSAARRASSVAARRAAAAARFIARASISMVGSNVSRAIGLPSTLPAETHTPDAQSGVACSIAPVSRCSRMYHASVGRSSFDALDAWRSSRTNAAIRPEGSPLTSTAEIREPSGRTTSSMRAVP